MEDQRGQCQVGRASCPASGVAFSSFLLALFGFCRFSLPGGGSTPPRRDTVGGWKKVKKKLS